MSDIVPLFKPRHGQQAAIDAFLRGYKRLVTVAHRRWGKDLRAWNMMWLAALREKGTYNYYWPTFKLGKSVIFKGMDNEGTRFIDYIPREIIKDINESDLRIELKMGSIINVIGTENISKNLVGINPRGVIFSEYALCDPQAWELTRPILTANGGWAMFVYTPRGRNHGYDLYQRAKANPDVWYSELITIEDSRRHDGTPIVTRAQVEQEIYDGMDPDLAQQEYYCSFEAPMQGSYYGHLVNALYSQGRIAPVAYKPGLPVYTAWDIGVRDSTAIWFAQLVGDDIHIIDYYQAHSQSFDHYFKHVMEKPYVYERMFFPHDVKQRQWESGLSTEELVTRAFRSRNIGVTVVDKLSINEGIEIVRRSFPRFRFDEHTVGKTKWAGHTALDAIVNYHKEWDDETHVFSDKPLHDWSSHSADSLRYLCVGLSRIAKPTLETLYKTAYNPLYDVEAVYTAEDENPLYDN